MESKDKWEFYQDKKSEWRWRRTATNGNIVGASSEGYKAKADATANAKRHGYENDTTDYKDKWEFYQDKKGAWRWRRTATNGNVVGKSTQGYKEKVSATDNAKKNGYKA
jgi:uncharacterized protein YegP (UPF0339 family)